MSEFNMAPVFRLEYFINAVLNGDTPPTPFYREEFYLAKMAGMDVDLPEPVFRREKYFAKLAGMDVEIPYPVNRDEFFLAAACGMEIDTPDPVFREEFWLNELAAENKLTTLTGTIVSFVASKSKAIRSLTVTLTPQQDLHGQDAPYPAGGGKNKLPITASSETQDGITFTVNSDGSVSVSGQHSGGANILLSQITLPEGSYKLSGGASNSLYINIAGKVNSYSRNFTSFNINSGGETISVKIYIASSEQVNAMFYPMICLGTETDTTFAPYSNICPITGWTGAKAYVTGVNAWDEEWERANINWTNYVFTPNASGGRLTSKNYIPVVPNQKYYAHLSRTITVVAGYVDENGNGGRAISLSSSDNTFTVPSDVKYIKFGVTVSDYGTTYNNDMSINYPSTDTDYHAYTGTTLTASFPDGQTVYGGEYEFVSGGLKSKMEMASVTDTDNISEAASTPASGKAFIISNKILDYAFNVEKYISNYYKPVAPGTAISSMNLGEFKIYQNDELGRIIIIDNSTETAESIKSRFANTPLQVLYELATPTPISITPQPISTLVGDNNIWSDAGDVAVTIPSNIIVEGT